MKARSTAGKALVLASILLLAANAAAAEVKVMVSSAFAAACQELARDFERNTGNKVVIIAGPSMGKAPEAILNRLQRGEPADVLIMVGYTLGDLVKQGKVLADSRVDLAESGIAMAVRAGAAKPDISSVEAFKNTLLKAKSIVYSDSASGIYVSTELYARLGLADQLKSKSQLIQAEPVGLVVARGEAELGFQQNSELLPIKGIEIVGPLPSSLQKMTLFAAGIAAGSKDPAAAKALIQFLASPAAAPVIRNTGMEPITKTR
jgi:molybdate transport system substrate-binding protein